MTQRKIILFVSVFLIIAGIMSWGGSYFLSMSFPFFKGSAPSIPSSLSIGVVDINKIKLDSRVFQSFTQKLENLNTSIHREILEKENKWRAQHEQFKKRQEEAKAPSQEILKQKTDLDKKYSELEEIAHTRREALNEEYTNGINQIKYTLKEIINTLGVLHGLKIILNKSLGDGNQMDQSVVLFSSDGIDLTDEVIKRLDNYSTLKK